MQASEGAAQCRTRAAPGFFTELTRHKTRSTVKRPKRRGHTATVKTFGAHRFFSPRGFFYLKNGVAKQRGWPSAARLSSAARSKLLSWAREGFWAAFEARRPATTSPARDRGPPGLSFTIRGTGGHAPNREGALHKG